MTPLSLIEAGRLYLVLIGFDSSGGIPGQVIEESFERAGLDEMEEHRLWANGLTFNCLVHGQGTRTALLLHGFPDDAGSMKSLMVRLAGDGFTAVAPYMRGYAGTERAPDGKYYIHQLAADAVELSRVFGGEETVLIGHDWGAVAAYAVANLAPKRFSRMVALAVPPPRTLLLNLLKHPRQFRRSWYMFFFQLPWIPERALVKNDFVFVERLWRDWSPGWDYPLERISEVKRSLRSPGTVRAALAYYRALLRDAVRSLRDYRTSLTLSLGMIETPMLILAGKDDGCMGIEVFEGLERSFRGPVRFEAIPNAGHFMHLERPETVQARIVEFLG